MRVSEQPAGESTGEHYRNRHLSLISEKLAVKGYVEPVGWGRWLPEQGKSRGQNGCVQETPF